MQFACQAAALVFVRRQQPAGQLLDLAVAGLEHGLALADPFFGMLSFADVDIAADVAHIAAIRCVLWSADGQQPAPGAVGFAHTVLQLERLPGVHRRNIVVADGAEVVRMHARQPAVVEKLLEGQP